MSHSWGRVLAAVGVVVVMYGSGVRWAEAAPPAASPPSAPPEPSPPPVFPPNGGPVVVPFAPAQPPPAPSPMGSPEVAPALPPPSGGGCVKDTECKGDRICSEGRCIPPPSTMAPPLPPPPAPSHAPSVAPPQPPAAPSTVVIYAPPPDRLESSGASFGLRFGVGFPSGDVSPAVPTANIVGFLFPVTLDIGYRVNPHWYAGGFISIGYGTAPASTCAAGGSGTASCYESDIRFGLDVQYRFYPDGVIQPWVGLGAAWEILNELATDAMGNSESSSKNGAEIVHLDLGLDFRLTERDKLGPYFEGTLGDFTGSFHEWFTVGARYRHDLDTWHRPPSR